MFETWSPLGKVYVHWGDGQDLTDQHQPDIAAKDGGNEGSHKFVTKSIVSRESFQTAI